MNNIHPTAIIGSGVRLGTGNVIGPHVVISGNTSIGNDNWIGPGSCIGTEGDILGRPTSSGIPFWAADSDYSDFGVIVGNQNVLKEHVTIHAGSHRNTQIGDSCYLMPRSHLGHDCWLGDNVLLSPGAQIAGHVAIGSRTVVGMGALVHQFSSIGPIVMVGMGSCVRGNIEMCRTVVGEPHKVSGINKVGIKRLLGESALPDVMNALKNNVPMTDLPEPLRQMVIQWQSNIIDNH
jgi:UDP-N-acetylglucosamine acyltransferase